MRCIESKTLYFSDEKSDKIYIAELCEAGDGEFIVNFKYGRRGKTLREGTKTDFPEDEATAREIYEKLIASKVNKGYSETLGESTTQPSKTQSQRNKVSSQEDPCEHPRAEAIGKILSKAANKTYSDKSNSWPLSRVLWRAGEIGSKSFEPDLVKIDENAYGPHCKRSLAWALTRCGSEESVSKLTRLESQSTPLSMKLWIRSAILKLCNDTHKKGYLSTWIHELPDKVVLEVKNGTTESLLRSLDDEIQRSKGQNSFISYLCLYYESIPHVREALLELCTRLPLAPGTFREIRYLYKIAELCQWGDLWGRLSYRFEKGEAFFHRCPWTKWHWLGRERIEIKKELQLLDSRLAYSDRTRLYLRQRICRTLRRLGELEDSISYTELATGYLLQFDDHFDRNKPQADYQYTWTSNGYTTNTIHYDVYAPYLAFNQVLYGLSARYSRKERSRRWHCVDYEPGNEAPSAREDIYPHLWDQQPRQIIKLLTHSSCLGVIEFATKVFRDNPSFSEHASVELIIALLTKPLTLANELGLDLARELASRGDVNIELYTALIDSPLKEARALGIELIFSHLDTCLAKQSLVAKLISSPYVDIVEKLSEIFTKHAWNKEQAASILNKVFDILLALTLDKHKHSHYRDLFESWEGNIHAILNFLEQSEAHMEDAQLQKLIQAPHEELQALAGEIILLTPDADTISGNTIKTLIESNSIAIRALGTRILARQSDEALMKKESMLVELFMSRLPDMREKATPLIERLAKLDANFGTAIVKQTFPYLNRKERYEGLHQDILNLLTGSLQQFLHIIPEQYYFRLIDSRYPAAQELGWFLASQKIDFNQLPMNKLTKLGCHDLGAVRQSILDYFKQNVSRIKQELEDALRILDNPWEESREHAFEFFRTELNEQDWTPSLLVSICDSVNPAVQAFGRELITKFFKTNDGAQYLLQLSQHPSHELQSFATHYLERFAAGSPDRISQLNLYFVTILSRINKGRVAKKRVLHFLKEEALKDKEVSQQVIKIMTSQSLNVATSYQAEAIQMMLAIQNQFPDLDTPLKIHSIAEAPINS